MTVLWAAIQNYPHYEVSSHGQVRNTETGKLLKQVCCWNRQYTKVTSIQVSLTSKLSTFSIHRLMYQAFVGPIPDDMVIDHINRNPLDNTLTNLRCTSRAVNARNTAYRRGGTKSSYLGVSWVVKNKRKRWTATTQHNGRQIAIGRFDTELEAALAYDKKVLELGFDSSMTNFPTPGEH